MFGRRRHVKTKPDPKNDGLRYRRDSDSKSTEPEFRPNPLVGARAFVPWNHVTIYGCSEGEVDTLDVPLQRLYKGPRQVLPSDAASIPCSDLGVSGLLEKMNFHLNTSFILDTARQSLLETSLRYANDFGVAYSLLRPRWDMDPLEAIENIDACCDRDVTVRRDVLRGEVIVKKYMRPRRLWDLWSNRIVPTWMVYTEPWEEEDPSGHGIFQLQNYQDFVDFFAVSHAWLEADKRQGVDTPINGHEWPVPIPSTTTLERIRTELLHHTTNVAPTVHLVWLDVLCLRQEGKQEDEPRRKEEWKLDIPTIGAVYDGAKSVVYYYSGLGLPFQIGDLTSHRHWLNRVWTLQEHKDDFYAYVAGVTARSPPIFSLRRDDKSLDSSVRAFVDKMVRIRIGLRDHRSLLEAIKEIRRRSATSELDKIGGLNFLSEYNTECALPIYIIGEDPEDMWWRFIRALDDRNRAEFFFFFPQPGEGTGNRPAWCPSWHQLDRIPARLPLKVRDCRVQFDINLQEYWLEHRHIDCYITGFADIDSAAGNSREGEVAMQGARGERLIFRAVADHDQPLSDGRYTLVIAEEEREVQAPSKSKSQSVWMRLESEWAEVDDDDGDDEWEDEESLSGSSFPSSEEEEEEGSNGSWYIRCAVGSITRSDATTTFKKSTVIDILENKRLWLAVTKNRRRLTLA